PVEGDVEGPDRHGGALDPFDLGGKPPSQVVPASRDADQDDPTRAAIALHDLVGDARHGALDVGIVHESSPLDERGHRRPPTGAAQKETPRGVRGARRYCISVSLPGLTGPDLKGKSSPRRIAEDTPAINDCARAPLAG